MSSYRQWTFLFILHACTCHGSIIVANLMGLWRCCPAWALSSGSHDTCHPRRCLPAFLIKPSSRTSPGSVVWVESAKTPGSKRALAHDHIYPLFWQHGGKKNGCLSSQTKLFYWVTTGLKSMVDVWWDRLTFPPRRMWYQTEVPPKSMWKSVKQPWTLMRQYLRSGERTENTMWILDKNKIKCSTSNWETLNSI